MQNFTGFEFNIFKPILLALTSLPIFIQDMKSLRVQYISVAIIAFLGIITLGHLSTLPEFFITLLWSMFTGCLLYCVAHLYKLYRQYNGMGEADPYIVTALALWLKPIFIPYFLISSCLLTLLFGVMFFKSSQNLSRIKIPFAPGMVISSIIFSAL